MNWYAINTKAGREDSVAGRMREAGIEVYSPKLKARKYLRGRFTDVVEPLFPCYLFARFDPRLCLWMITYTRGVKKVVGGTDGPWPVSPEIVDLVQSRESGGVIPAPSDEFREGDVVEVAHGPLAGLSGIYERPLKGSERVLLLLHAMTYQARAVVERASLTKVS
jgi:transcriptional antiterminator RfaH